MAAGLARMWKARRTREKEREEEIMDGLWFTVEQIKREHQFGKFNSPYQEDIFRARIAQDWLKMHAAITQLQDKSGENQRLRKLTVELVRACDRAYYLIDAIKAYIDPALREAAEQVMEELESAMLSAREGK